MISDLKNEKKRIYILKLSIDTHSTITARHVPAKRQRPRLKSPPMLFSFRNLRFESRFVRHAFPRETRDAGRADDVSRENVRARVGTLERV